MTFSFAFELTPQERTDIAQRRRRGSRFHWPSAAHEFGSALIAAGVATTGTLGWILRSTPRWYDVGAAFVGWVTLALIVVPAVLRRLTNALAGAYGVPTPVTVTADGRRVVETMKPGKYEQWGWDELRSIQSGADGVTLEFRDGKSCWIPVRAFRRAKGRAEFVEYADRMRRPPEVVEQTTPRGALPLIAIPSGEWRWETESREPELPPYKLTLVDACDERNKLTIDLDASDVVSDETIGALTRNPSRREWVGEDGVQWRIAFPQDDMANAVPVHWPAGMVEPARVVWFQPVGTDAADTLPWTGLGHVTHAELLEWFSAQRTRPPRSQTADAD